MSTSANIEKTTISKTFLFSSICTVLLKWRIVIKKTHELLLFLHKTMQLVVYILLLVLHSNTLHLALPLTALSLEN